MAEERLSAVLLDTLTSVLREYERRSQLAEELLAAIEQTRARDKDVDTELQRLRECVLELQSGNNYRCSLLCKGCLLVKPGLLPHAVQHRHHIASQVLEVT